MFSAQPPKGEKSLSKLLSTLTTVLHDPTYVFVTVPSTAPLPPLSEIDLFFRESEGVTLITTREFAVAQRYEFFYPCKKITLDVHSSLEAVGFMATIATRLAAEAIPVNPVSGYYHDHLFIGEERAEEAVALLAEMVRELNQ